MWLISSGMTHSKLILHDTHCHHRVNRQRGLFYFDSSFRPIPLEQHFIGVKGKFTELRKNLDRVAFEKVSELVAEGHQVMVFVHSRKDTVNTALSLKEAALAEGSLDDFSCEEHPSHFAFKRELSTSRNKEMKELFDFGFGIHHAGMLRPDRNMMERMFDARAIKVRHKPNYWREEVYKCIVLGPLLYGDSCLGSQLTCACR